MHGVHNYVTLQLQSSESKDDEAQDDKCKDSKLKKDECKKDEKKLPLRGKKRKQQSKLEKSLEVVMDKYVAVQQDMEDKYVELEEKRLKFMKESEAYKIEVEERRREADRQHELQMWSMFMNVCGGGRMTYNAPPPPMGYQSYYDHVQYSGSGMTPPVQPSPPPNSPTGL